MKNKRKKEVLANIEATKNAARECLGTDSFIRYRAKYQKLEELTLNILFEYNEPDPIKYAFEVKSLLLRLQDLRLLLKSVSKEAK